MSKIQPKLISTLKNYTLDQFGKDIVAGIIVAIIALPLSIALAIASGVSPEKGLYTAIVAGFIISAFGGSRVQIGGPTGAFMVIVYGIVTEFGIEGLTIATIMAGIILMIMGFLRLGNVIKFIPYPITTGFTSGIAVIIFSSQVNDFLGLGVKNLPADFLGKWEMYYKSYNHVDLQTTLIGVLALAIIMIWPKINKRIPGALIAIIVTSMVVQLMHLDVSTIASKFGVLSSSLPKPELPNITLDKIKMLMAPAFSIAILGGIESLLSAVVADGMISGKHRSNMELIAQGLANIASGCFGGIPATGAIARTAANIKNGGRTPVAGMVHALTLFLIMVLFMPLAKMIPLPALAAILMVVAYNMSEWREFKSLFSSPKSDVLVLLITFFLTIMIDLVKAIEVGVVISSFLFMKRMSDVTSVKTYPLDASEETDRDKNTIANENESILLDFKTQIYEINGPFFFGAADKFVETFGALKSDTKYLIVRMRHVPAMDATALHAFKILLNVCEHKHIDVVISGLTDQPRSVLEKAGIIERIGRHRLFENLSDAIEYIKVL